MIVSAFIAVLAPASRPDQIKWTTRIVAKTVAVFAFSTAVAAQPPVWVSEGPSPTTAGQVEGIADGPVAGAIKAVAPHPNDANVVYIGAVNGGVWKTTDASSKRPHWKPLTDDQKSLSIGALAFDPTDRTYQTLVAGTGRFSSDAGIGSALIGLLRTTDGGASWTTIPATRPVSDANITNVVLRGDVIVISSDRGVFRLANGQWKKISGAADTGLPRGPAFDLIADPTNPARLFTNGGPKGIYRSDDTGATWTKVSDAALDALLLPCRSAAEDCTKNLRIAVGTANNVYVGIANGHAQSELAGLFRSGDGGATWTPLDLPQTVEAGGAVFGLYSEGQAEIDFSIAADPQNPNIVYVGGDAQPAFDETNPSPPRSGAESDQAVGPTPSAPAPIRGGCSASTPRCRQEAKPRTSPTRTRPPGRRRMPIHAIWRLTPMAISSKSTMAASTAAHGRKPMTVIGLRWMATSKSPSFIP